MFEQFSNYSEVKWCAAPAVKSIGLGGKISINPDVGNFTLVRFRDLRKQPNRKNEVLLSGNNETNIFIEGPDVRLDPIIERLPNYIGKTWAEINKMSLEKNFLNCNNAFTLVCNPELKDNIELKPLKSGEEKPEIDFAKIDEICVRCDNFIWKII